jgi:hypothetical protein
VKCTARAPRAARRARARMARRLKFSEFHDCPICERQGHGPEPPSIPDQTLRPGGRGVVAPIRRQQLLTQEGEAGMGLTWDRRISSPTRDVDGAPMTRSRAFRVLLPPLKLQKCLVLLTFSVSKVARDGHRYASNRRGPDRSPQRRARGPAQGARPPHRGVEGRFRRSAGWSPSRTRTWTTRAAPWSAGARPSTWSRCRRDNGDGATTPGGTTR